MTISRRDAVATGQVPPRTEAELLARVLVVAHAHGWLCHHSRPARRANGRWSTPLQGDAGLPDLVLVHPTRHLVWLLELKQRGKKPTPEQSRWLRALEASARAIGSWGDTTDMDALERVLREGW